MAGGQCLAMPPIMASKAFAAAASDLSKCAGKSTMVTMLRDRVRAADRSEGTILSDDRVVMRRWRRRSAAAPVIGPLRSLPERREQA